ncbi:MAG: lipocalin-like domain-containing protein [Acidobacteria bacterium]|nr:lipocalin-like domain-containing protein [Acidobacteriota bacterium]
MRMCVVVLGCLTAASPVFAQGAPKAPKGEVTRLIAGTWRMVGVETRVVDGSGPTTYPRGKTPAGYIIYDSQGRMYVQIMNSDEVRPPRKGEGPMTEKEQARAYATYTAYFGRYTINEEEQSVTHHVEGSVNPRNIGNGMHRFVEVSSDRLSLNTFAKGPDGKERVTLRMWERVR